MLWWNLVGIWYQGVYYWPLRWILGSVVLLQGHKTHLMLREINNKSAQKSAYELSTRQVSSVSTSNKLCTTPSYTGENTPFENKKCANSRPPGIKFQPNFTTACVKGQKVSLKKSRGDVLSRFLMDFPSKWTYFESPWGNISHPKSHRKALLWPLVPKTKQFLAIQFLKRPKAETQALYLKTMLLNHISSDL